MLLTQSRAAYIRTNVRMYITDNMKMSFMRISLACLPSISFSHTLSLLTFQWPFQLAFPTTQTMSLAICCIIPEHFRVIHNASLVWMSLILRNNWKPQFMPKTNVWLYVNCFSVLSSNAPLDWVHYVDP